MSFTLRDHRPGVYVKGRREKCLGLRGREWQEIWENCTVSRIIILLIISRIRLAGPVARMGEQIDTCKVLVRKPKRKRPLWRSRLGWEDIKIDLKETERDGVDRHVLWTGMIKLRVAYNAGNSLTTWGTVNVPRRAVFHGQRQSLCKRVLMFGAFYKLLPDSCSARKARSLRLNPALLKTS